MDIKLYAVLRTATQCYEEEGENEKALRRATKYYRGTGYKVLYSATKCYEALRSATKMKRRTRKLYAELRINNNNIDSRKMFKDTFL